MEKHLKIFALLAFFAVIVAILAYLYFNTSIFPAFLYVNQSNITPSVTTAENEDSTGSIWVWMSNLQTLQENNQYYLTGKIKNLGQVKLLLGSKDESIGSAVADDVPDELTSEFPDYYPDWSVTDIENLVIEASNFDKAVVKIYTKEVLIDDPSSCDELCQHFIYNQQLLIHNNLSLLNKSKKAEEMTIGPAIQVLFYKAK